MERVSEGRPIELLDEDEGIGAGYRDVISGLVVEPRGRVCIVNVGPVSAGVLRRRIRCEHRLREFSIDRDGFVVGCSDCGILYGGATR